MASNSTIAMRPIGAQKSAGYQANSRIGKKVTLCPKIIALLYYLSKKNGIDLWLFGIRNANPLVDPRSADQKSSGFT